MSSVTVPPTPPKVSASLRHRWDGWLCLGIIVIAIGLTADWLWSPRSISTAPSPTETPESNSVAESARRIDQAFAESWQSENLVPVQRADDLTIARRLSLALTGAIPSLEDVRAFEAQPENSRISWWVDRLLDDQRSSDYLAERLARAYVGVENGPFLVFRRRRLVRWLSEQLQVNRPYDELVRELITAEGLWTTNPAANFITATVKQGEEDGGPDQVKLAIRTTRAFLGVRMDCMQCHDDKFGDRWKQEDFHQLAAFFAGAEMELTGVRDDVEQSHEIRFKGEREERTVLPLVPFSRELMPSEGRPRERLAAWATHPDNRSFARSTVNRAWAILWGQPMIAPIDDIPLDASDLPAGLEVIVDDFIAHEFDFQHLLRVLSQIRPFQSDSRSLDPDQPLTKAHEQHWAAFPLTRLRPEQVAGSIVQAAYLDTIDDEAPFLIQLAKFGQQNEFVKRYGDLGEAEFSEQPGTIPQRLLMMNGKMVTERIDENPVINAVTRINTLAPDPSHAIDAAYLCAFTRRPSDGEKEHFLALLKDLKKPDRHRAMEDLYWSLLNATEFSWNH